MRLDIVELNFACDEDDWEALDDFLDDVPPGFGNILMSNILERVETCASVREYVPKGQAVDRNVQRAKKRGLQADLTTYHWDKIVAAFEYCCAYCSAPVEGCTYVLEHVVPIAAGGGTTWRNVVPACVSCNKSKGTRYLLGWLKQRFGSKHVEIASNMKRVRSLLLEEFKC